MSLYDTTWYCNAGDQSTTGYYAVAKRPQNTAVVAGQLCRQFTAPSLGNERVFVCIVAGTTANVTDATWVLTRGAKTTDGTATWMEATGQAALNGDLTNTATWAQVKAVTPAVLGQVIKRSNGASYQICTTAGAMSASEPSFSDTAGVTTTDTTAVWTSLGVVGNFTGGQAPHARLANACATNWFASGNTIYVGDNHAESTGSTIAISPASALMARILCHNHSGSYPPAASDLTTGASITQTAADFLNFTPQGSFYLYGIAFKTTNAAGALQFAIASSVGQVQNWVYCDNCSFWPGGISGNTFIIGNSPGWNIVTFNNTTVKLGGTGTTLRLALCDFTWRNTGPILVSGSSIPTTLFTVSNTSGAVNTITLEALDLSQLTGSLFSNASASSIGNLAVKDCKLNASMTIPNSINTGQTIQIVRSDGAGTNYKSSGYTYEGTETTETSITRVGGATDGTTATSVKLVTTANAQWLRPFVAMPLAIWNETTAANLTVTVYGTVNAGALPNNDDIWIGVEYLGSSASPLGTIKTTTKASLLAANAAVASDGSSWNGGGSGAGWTPFKLTITLSSPQPGMKGFIYITVKAAKASATFYVDPLPALT